LGEVWIEGDPGLNLVRVEQISATRRQGKTE